MSTYFILQTKHIERKIHFPSTSHLHLTKQNEKIQTSLDFKGPTGRVWFELIIIMVRAITSASEKLCKIVQNGKRGSFYTIWAKKRPTSVWANLCINASCYSTSANMHGYCSAPIYYFIFLSLSSINSHLIISPLSFDLSLFFCPLNPFIFY